MATDAIREVAANGLSADQAPPPLRPYIEAGFAAIELYATSDQWGTYTAAYAMQKDGKDAGHLTVTCGRWQLEIVPDTQSLAHKNRVPLDMQKSDEPIDPDLSFL